MPNVKILGIVGSPRAKANTELLVEEALRGAEEVRDVKTELWRAAGKKIHPCNSCFECTRTAACVYKDDFQPFARKYLEADGLILGCPVYHMGVTPEFKALVDRLGSTLFMKYAYEKDPFPRFSKVGGVITVGGSRFGGQEFTLQYMINHLLLMNNIVVSGDIIPDGTYIGVAGFTGPGDAFTKFDSVKSDVEAFRQSRNLGRRVAELTKIVKIGLETLKKELPKEYFDVTFPK